MSTQPQKGRSLSEFLDIVHQTVMFIQSQKINGRPLTDDERLLVMQITEILINDCNRVDISAISNNLHSSMHDTLSKLKQQ